MAKLLIGDIGATDKGTPGYERRPPSSLYAPLARLSSRLAVSPRTAYGRTPNSLPWEQLSLIMRTIANGVEQHVLGREPRLVHRRSN